MSSDLAREEEARLGVIHTLVVDLDDTLFPEREFVVGGFLAAGEWLKRKHGVLGFAARATQLLESGRRGKIFDEALRDLGVAAESSLVEELVRVYREHRPVLVLFPDARELLDWAATRFNVALLTDGFEAVQRNKIHALGLEERIGLRILSDALGGLEFWKPSTAPFEVVMRHFHGPAAGYLYVSDNPRKDFIGPRALGWRTVRIVRPGGEHSAYVPTAAEEADISITDLMQLPSLIAKQEVRV